MRLCVFDLDHTLVRSPLDLRAMARDMQAALESAHGPLPPPPDDRWRVGELLARCQQVAPELETALWDVAAAHEREALAAAEAEPGALEAVEGARDAGWVPALWTNNARDTTLVALERAQLAGRFETIVTRDDMAALKPAPDGWATLAARFGADRAAPERAVVVGDSWVDGLAARRAGVPFIAYRPDPGELERRGVRPAATLDDLRDLPRWLVRAGLSRQLGDLAGP